MTVDLGNPHRSDVAQGLTDDGRLVILDLPVNTPIGLEYPNDLAQADFLAFELAVLGALDTRYELLSVELLELHPGEAALSGATVGPEPMSDALRSAARD